MATMVTSRVIEASPDDVFAVLSDFGRWDQFVERIEAVSLENGRDEASIGTVRTVQLAGGAVIQEQLVACDAASRTIAYGFPGEFPFPVRSFVTRIQLWPVTTTGSTFVLWTVDFDADADAEEGLRTRFEQTYSAFLAQLDSFVSHG